MASRVLHLSLRILILAMFLVIVTASGSDWHHHVKMKSSWPHLTGARDMNYDNLIVPGVRIGPVALGGSVEEVVRHLGNPDYINLGTFSGSTDAVRYIYNTECIWFTWHDSGLDPKVDVGGVGGEVIGVDCDKWRTAAGAHVGSLPSEAVHGEYCSRTMDKGDMYIEQLSGIEFAVNDRYSPIKQISVTPSHTQWWRGCRND